MPRTLDPIRRCALRAALLCACAIALTGCGTYAVTPGDSITKLPVNGKAITDTALDLFGTQLGESAKAPNDAAKASAAFAAGRAFLDLRCAAYLDNIGSANQVATDERNQLGLVGGLAAALMGLTGSPVKHVSGIATSFSFASSSLDSRATTFLFSDAGKSVGRLVRSAQTAYLDAVRPQVLDSGFSYDQAVNLLMGYEAVCRPAEIRSRIDEAIANNTVQADAGAPQPSDAATKVVLQKLADDLGRPGLSEDDAILLYAWYTTPAQRAQLVTQEPLKSELGDNKPEAIAALQKKLQPAFQSLALRRSAVAVRWAADVAALVKPAEPAPPKPAATAPGSGVTPPPPPTPPQAPATAKPANSVARGAPLLRSVPNR